MILITSAQELLLLNDVLSFLLDLPKATKDMRSKYPARDL